MLQVAWLVDGDPWVLLRLRGLSPDDLQAELAAATDGPPDTEADDLAVAMDAAVRAARGSSRWPTTGGRDHPPSVSG